MQLGDIAVGVPAELQVNRDLAIGVQTGLCQSRHGLARQRAGEMRALFSQLHRVDMRRQLPVGYFFRRRHVMRSSDLDGRPPGRTQAAHHIFAPNLCQNRRFSGTARLTPLPPFRKKAGPIPGWTGPVPRGAFDLIKKILVANRGEIAVRVVRACAEMGITSAAIYTDADRHALHVKKADEAYNVGPDPVGGYLNAHRIVNLAVASGCDALHPGYGFLSENPQLAEICARRDIIFIGPSPAAIRRMGDKTLARAAMIQAGVPVVPGSEGNLKNVADAVKLAKKVGYPVMLKATSGGGGRGIRRCHTEEELRRAYERVVSEATKAFGSAEVFLEKAVVNPRHIEVQVLGDKYGNVIHLFERDCSIQRRHQKLVEIAPSPQLTDQQRTHVCELGVLAAKTVHYENAGTVEFLLDQNGEFYFMEMNTRLQVEHTVTEQITGVDIVQEQINIAAGLPLSYRQDQTSSAAATRSSSVSTPRTQKTISCRTTGASRATTRRVDRAYAPTPRFTPAMSSRRTMTRCAPSSLSGRSRGKKSSRAGDARSWTWACTASKPPNRSICRY